VSTTLRPRPGTRNFSLLKTNVLQRLCETLHELKIPTSGLCKDIVAHSLNRLMFSRQGRAERSRSISEFFTVVCE